MMMKCRTFIFLAMVSAAAAQDGAKEDSGKVIELKSPDGSLTAYARRAPDEEVFWKVGSDGTLLAIAGRNFEENKRWNIGGLLISEIKWSPDSKFLVMTMESSGGHSPWQFRTFTYSVADGSLRFNNLDEMRPVISPKFSFEKPDTLVLSVLDNETQEKTGEDFPAKEVKVPLHEVFSKMEKREELKP